MKSKLSKSRKKIYITVRSDLHRWVEEQIEKGKFQSFCHAVDVAVEKLRDSEKKKENPQIIHVPQSNRV